MVRVQGLVNKAKGTDKNEIIAVILTLVGGGLGIYLLIRYYNGDNGGHKKTNRKKYNKKYYGS